MSLKPIIKRIQGKISDLDNLNNCQKKFILFSEAQGSVTDHGNRLKDETNFKVILVPNKTYSIRTTDFSNIVLYFFWGGALIEKRFFESLVKDLNSTFSFQNPVC